MIDVVSYFAHQEFNFQRFHKDNNNRGNYLDLLELLTSGVPFVEVHSELSSIIKSTFQIFKMI